MAYYTVVVWTPSDEDDDAAKQGFWEDTYGFKTKAEAALEIEFSHSHDPRGWTKIITTDGTRADLEKKRNALTAPRGWTLE